MAKAQQKISFLDRLKQIGMVFSYTAKRDKLFVPLVILATALPLISFIVLFALIGGLVWIIIGVLSGLLCMMVVLNLRSNKAMMSEAENTPGAAVSIVEMMRGDWRVTPAIASTTQYDMIHLVLGRVGIVLIGEGNPQRVRQLMGQEKRRLSKVVGSTDIRDLIIGSEEGEVPVSKLRTTLLKMPRTTSAKDVNALDKRLKALSSRPQMPKGAIPKNMRPPKGAMRGMRGR